MFKAALIQVFFAMLANSNRFFREKLLVPYLGEAIAFPLSRFMLSTPIFNVTYVLPAFTSSFKISNYWTIGILWLQLTFIFEFGSGHFEIGNSWQRLLDVSGLLEENLLLLVFAGTAPSPYLAEKPKGNIKND